jgi:hypothetical protein
MNIILDSRLLLLVVLLSLIVSGLVVAIPPAQAVPVDVTVTIKRVIELLCPDFLDVFEGCPGDYFIRAKIGASEFQQSPRIDGPGPVNPLFQGRIQDPCARLEGPHYEISPSWTFTARADSTRGTIPLVIELRDHDGITGSPLVDINPSTGKMHLDLQLNLNTGTLSGDVPDNVGQSTGQTCPAPFDDPGTAKILFDVSFGDIDSDGIPDRVELVGALDQNGNPSLKTNRPEGRGFGFPMDPCRKTVAVEIDYMSGAAGRHNHRPLDAAMAFSINTFDSSGVPAVNPCPFTGFPTRSDGVNLVIDVDDAIGEVQFLCGPSDRTICRAFDNIKRANFDSIRKPYFHYSEWIHDIDNRMRSAGRAEFGGNDLTVALGAAVGTDARIVFLQIPVFMHELGHNLRLQHGGGEAEPFNCKPNYLSVMNYAFADGIPNPTLNPRGDLLRRFDYSHAPPPLSLLESALSENAGIQDGTDITIWGPPLPGPAMRGGQGNSPLNWDWDNPPVIDDDPRMTPNPSTVNVDINDLNSFFPDDSSTARIEGCPTSPGQTLSGFDDWANLDYIFTDDDDYADGVHRDVPDETGFTVENLEKLKAAKDASFGANPPPETTIDSATDSQGNPIQNGSSTQSSDIFFEFSSPDTDVSGFECKLDSSDWELCQSGEGGGVTEGEHTFSVRAFDSVGNVDPTHAMVSWTVDLTAPETTIDSATDSQGNTIQNGSSTQSSDISFKFSSADSDVLTFQCSLDGSDWQDCTSPVEYTALQVDMQHIFSVISKDSAGNVDQTPATFNWTIVEDNQPMSLGLT